MNNNITNKLHLAIIAPSWTVTFYLPQNKLSSPDLALHILSKLSEKLLNDSDYLPVSSMQYISAFLSSQQWAGGTDNIIKIKILNNNDSTCITFDKKGRAIFYQDKTDDDFMGYFKILKNAWNKWIDKIKKQKIKSKPMVIFTTNRGEL